MSNVAVNRRRWGWTVVVAAAVGGLGGCTLKLSFDDQNKAAMTAPSPDTSVGRLTALLSAEDPDVRAVAATELGTMGPRAKSAQQQLADLLNDRDRHVRFVAARSLAQIDPTDPATPPTLVLIANDSQATSDDRAAAVTLLGSLGPQSVAIARPALQRLSDDQDPAVRTAARAAYARVDVAAPTTRPTTRPAQPVSTVTPVQPYVRPEPVKAPTTRPAAATVADKPTTQPNAQIARASVPSQDDAIPKADVTTFGIERYSPEQLERVRAWIHRQPYLTPDQQRDHIARFEEWNTSQENRAKAVEAAASGAAK